MNTLFLKRCALSGSTLAGVFITLYGKAESKGDGDTEAEGHPDLMGDSDRHAFVPLGTNRSCALGRCKILNRAGLDMLLQKKMFELKDDQTYLIDTTQTKFDSMDSEINPVLNFDPPTELDTTQPGFIPSEDNEETRLQYDHVIIGAGKAGTAAVTVLKQVREGDSVLMVGGMKTPRINRLCDSKDELNGLLVERVMNPGSRVDYILGQEVAALYPTLSCLVLNDGREVVYKNALLATGGKCTALPITDEDKDALQDKAIVVRDLQAFATVLDSIKSTDKVCVVGGGVFGGEVVTGLRRKKKKFKLLQVFGEDSLMGSYLPPYLSKLVESAFEKKNVQLIRNTRVTNIAQENTRVAATLASTRDAVQDVQLNIGYGAGEGYGAGDGYGGDEGATRPVAVTTSSRDRLSAFPASSSPSSPSPPPTSTSLSSPSSTLSSSSPPPPPGVLATWLPLFFTTTTTTPTTMTEERDDQPLIGFEMQHKDDLGSGTLKKEQLVVDKILLAETHIPPNIDLATRSKLWVDETTGGVSCDKHLRAYDGNGDVLMNVFVAGDIASYPDKHGCSTRIQSYDNAIRSGKAAGHNMAGDKVVYSGMSREWQDLRPMGLWYSESVGKVRTGMQTVGFYSSASQGCGLLRPVPPSNSGMSRAKGGLFYLDDNNRIKGATLFNIQASAADIIIKRIRHAIENDTTYSHPQHELRSMLTPIALPQYKVIVTDEHGHVQPGSSHIG